MGLFLALVILCIFDSLYGFEKKENFFEDDILLSRKQLDRIKRVKRKVIVGGLYRWPKGRPIPYSFTHKDENWKNTIRSGMQLWEHETCIRFQELTRWSLFTDQIQFIKDKGCYSNFGRIGGLQEVSIGDGCEDRGVIAHEVGHILGFVHEHSRPDRFLYVNIDHKYLDQKEADNLDQNNYFQVDDMGLPYDLGSIMHYRPDGFATGGHNTVITIDPKYQHTIGQRERISFIDAKAMNRLYCNNICSNVNTECHRGGYPNPNNCFQCKCPSGLGGRACDQLESSICGGELLAENFWKNLSYHGRERCIWRINSYNTRIRLKITDVQYSCETTCKSYVEIKHNSDFQQTGFRVCCPDQKFEIVSDQNEILIISNKNYLKNGKFSLQYIKENVLPQSLPPPMGYVPGQENQLIRGFDGRGAGQASQIFTPIEQNPLTNIAYNLAATYLEMNKIEISNRTSRERKENEMCCDDKDLENFSKEMQKYSGKKIWPELCEQNILEMDIPAKEIPDGIVNRVEKNLPLG